MIDKAAAETELLLAEGFIEPHFFAGFSGGRKAVLPGICDRVTQNKIKGSMSKAGCPYDNSPMESFFASLKKEYFYRREYATIQDVERDLFYYIEVFYNRKSYSSLGYMSPAAY